MTMRPAKQKKLKTAGWKIGTVAEFLDLNAAESAYVEMKLALSDSLRKQRQKNNLSQIALAKLLKSSQSRVAKMEAGDPSVSLDLLLWSLLALGATPKEVAKVLTATGSAPARR